MGTLFCSINDSKKTCSLYFVEYICVLMSTEAEDSITVSAHLISEQLTRNCEGIVELHLFLLGFLFIGRLVPEIQYQILQLWWVQSAESALCCSRTILQNGIFGKIWVRFCEHLPFLYRALKSNSKDRWQNSFKVQM